MEKSRMVRLLTSCSIMCLLSGFLVPSALADGPCEEPSGVVVSVQGSVETRKADATRWIPVELDDALCPGDSIRVLELGRAEIRLENESFLKLKENCAITFPDREEKEDILARVLRGFAYFFSRTRKSIEIHTPFVNGTIEGTEFYARVEMDHTFLSVLEGRLKAENEAGSVLLESNQSAITYAGRAPVIRMVARPRDAVQWALYYPPAADYRAADFPGETWQEEIRASIGHYRRGDLVRAFSSLEGLPDDVPDPRYHTYRAGLLLAVGQVDKAEEAIKNALNLDPANGPAFALRSVIAVMQNRKDDALELAKQAVESDVTSSTAMVALSYAQQAHFQIRKALASAREAARLDPEDALAKARLAELLLAEGDLGRALATAQEASASNPNLAHTQTILGFAYLSQTRTGDAQDAFGEAIRLDQTAPLPRLGLGLAKIREGEVKEGRELIEIAMGLDPGNSLIRSYLGKAYFEEKRDKDAESQLGIAKELDPFDPTPWFYDALRKQTMNRPVEALHDLQRSIELNDSRAVYRSNLMLDEDLAVRSASLARIYSDLGFRQLALVEGWKSLNTDPANHSAHRFLADVYSVLPRHEIARVSELLQAQLLQPINITPLQPHLAESNLFITEGAGPADTALNEFSPLFHRNRFALQANGMTGGNETLGYEAVHSGVWNKISYSLGQFHYETEGYRANDAQEQDVYNAFIHGGLTHKTSLQAEYRYKETEKGDIELRFTTDDDHLTSLQDTNEQASIRLGFHHTFSPRSDLIGTVSKQTEDPRLQDSITGIEPEPGMLLDVDLEMRADTESHGRELQCLFHSERFSLIMGAGYFDIDSTRTQTDVTTVTLSLPFPPFSFSETTTQVAVLDEDSTHTNFYLYSQINYPETVTWTIGASGDLFEGVFVDSDQYNPKLGLTWNPMPNTTLRLAAFRTLKRTLISDQTLEPTQVAGFNQFFDDGEGTDAWNYGFAIDHKYTKNLFGGMEYTMRDLTVPFEDWYMPPPPAPPVYEVKETDWEEKTARAYFYWTPKRWLVLTGEYHYEEFDRGTDFVAGIEQVKTHRVPLGVGLYLPTGLSGRLKATYVDQEGMFQPQTHPEMTPGDEQFWTLDASIAYRLPKRFGLFTIEAKNILDESFKYHDTDPENPRLQPESLVIAKFALAF